MAFLLSKKARDLGFPPFERLIRLKHPVVRSRIVARTDLLEAQAESRRNTAKNPGFFYLSDASGGASGRLYLDEDGKIAVEPLA